MGLANFFESALEYPPAELFIVAAAITDSVQKSAIRALVVNLRPIWKKLHAVYPMVGGTADSHKFNLKIARDSNAAYRLLYYGTAGHSAEGIAWGGVSYADTNLIFSNTVIPLNSLHVSYYSKLVVNTRGGEIGNLAISNGAYTGLFLRGTVYSSFYYVNDIGDNTTRTIGTTGLYLINRFGGTSSLIENNILRGSHTKPTSTVHNATTMLIGNANGWATSSTCAFATIGEGLTTAEGTLLYNAIQTFQTSLGRQA